MKEYCLCVDIGATRLRVAIARRDGTILDNIEESTPDIVLRSEEPTAIAETILQLGKMLLSRHGMDFSDLEGIGIGSIGPLDLRRGVIVRSPNLPRPDQEYPLRDYLQDRTKLPVYLANDCVAAVWGETTFGHGRGLENVLYVTMSTGIGGGAVVNGTLLLGADGNAHEIGHVVVDTSEDALVCGCGGLGHWEAYCSGMGIPKLIQRELAKKRDHNSKLAIIARSCKDPRDLTVYFFRLLKEGDPVCKEIFEKICVFNARGMASVIHLYNPELVILGGSIALNNYEHIMEFKKYLGQYLMRGFRIPEFKLTKFGDNVVLVGATALVFNTPSSLRKFLS